LIPIRDYPGERHRFPWVMLTILAVNSVVFVYELTQPSERALDLLFTSAGVVPVEFTRGTQIGAPPPLGLAWTALFTSMFLHGGLLHFGSNMLYLFIFGDNVEDRLGHLRFVIFYLLCGLVAGLTHILVNAGSTVPSIGASGAIAGVLAGYLRLFPTAEVRTLLILGPFITIPRLSAILLIGFWFVIQLLSGILSLGIAIEQTSGIAFWAHIGGFVAGLILVQFMVPSRRPDPAQSL
jgi:membrane associated rhomboid family serine protease